MQPRTYIIAEAGVNHNGDESIAMRLIDIAADAGADAVKFQMFDPAALVTGAAKTAEYQAKNLGDAAISQQAMLQKLCLSPEAFVRLYQHCTTRGIDFMCTAFDEESLNFLTKNTNMPFVKIPSGEVTNGPLLLAGARTGLPVILSTGMANLREVGEALSVLHFGYSHASGVPSHVAQPSPEMLHDLQDKVTILHCVSQYPALPESLNLHAMHTLRDAFGLPVGYSDHSLGITMPIAAAAMGITMIEKHFTFDVHSEGPDHKASLMPEELKAMVHAMRDVEQALGTGVKECQPSELSTRDVARRSVVAARAIAKGEAFSEQNTTCKRPATGGLAPNQLWQLYGKASQRAYEADEAIAADELGLSCA